MGDEHVAEHVAGDASSFCSGFPFARAVEVEILVQGGSPVDDGGGIPPEIMEKIIEIKSVVREPGDRTKIAVTSREKAVDPVGACVGIKGSRVQAVVRELRGEKIDIITWTQDPRVFIAEALNPATIEKVGIDEEKKSALVVAADSQLSLAIGKNGQNVRLAARLTGWKIDIISATEYEKEKVERDKEIKAALAEEAEAQRLQEEARQAARAEDGETASS